MLRINFFMLFLLMFRWHSQLQYSSDLRIVSAARTNNSLRRFKSAKSHALERTKELHEKNTVLIGSLARTKIIFRINKISLGAKKQHQIKAKMTTSNIRISALSFYTTICCLLNSSQFCEKGVCGVCVCECVCLSHFLTMRLYRFLPQMYLFL